MGAVVFAFLHHLAVLLIFACLFYEHLAIKPGLGLETARRLIRIDFIYGLSAATVLVIGLLRLFMFEKGGEYYLHNWAFYLKMGLFLAVGLISIYPTLVFMSWRDQIKKNIEPVLYEDQASRIALLIRAELLLISLMLPPAALMAKGYGLMN